MTRHQKSEEKPQIWAIGSGKGGTGKTFIITQLAIFLASYGNRVILIDADFHSPNMQHFIHFEPSGKSILDFFLGPDSLENLIQDTRIKNLKIIPGNQNGISLFNIKSKQRTKFYHEVRKTGFNYALLDLGSGSGQPTIDFFLDADRKLVVTDLEIISIDNLLHFLRNAYFHKLCSLLPTQKLKDTVRELWDNRQQYQIKTSLDLVNYLEKISDKIKPNIRETLSRIEINLVVNKIRKANDIMDGFSMRSICFKYLNLGTLYSGYLEYDNQLWKNFSLDPSKKFTISPRIEQEIINIAENIRNRTQMKIDRIKNV